MIGLHNQCTIIAKRWYVFMPCRYSFLYAYQTPCNSMHTASNMLCKIHALNCIKKAWSPVQFEELVRPKTYKVILILNDGIMML